jgi:hypothetical protein
MSNEVSLGTYRVAGVEPNRRQEPLPYSRYPEDVALNFVGEDGQRISTTMLTAAGRVLVVANAFVSRPEPGTEYELVLRLKEH